MADSNLSKHNRSYASVAEALALAKPEYIIQVDPRFRPHKADWPDHWVAITSPQDPIFCHARRDPNDNLVPGQVVFYFSRSGISVRRDGGVPEHKAVALLCARLAEKDGCAICKTRLWARHRTRFDEDETFSEFENEVLFFETYAVEEDRLDHKSNGVVRWEDAIALYENRTRKCQVLCRTCHLRKTQLWFERKLDARRAKLRAGETVDFGDE